MMASNGQIWLANLNPVKKSNEVGKTRPVLVFQNNELNHSDYPTTIIMPLTTALINDAEPIRIRVNKREGLERDSDIILTQIRAIDNRRFIKYIACLSTDELSNVKEHFYEIIE